MSNGRQDRIEIFRGDTFPLKWTLSRNGNWSLVGSTVKMSFKFDDDVVHTFVGTVLDYNTKEVEFTPTSEAVGTVRSGVFDIQVHDGVNPLTHKKGVVVIKEDVTP